MRASSPADSAFDPAVVMADAQRKEALTDWGPGEFEMGWTYSLHPEQVDERFTLYNKRFRQYIGGTPHA